MGTKTDSRGAIGEEDMAFGVRCACGWEWREIVANDGLIGIEKFCPRCSAHSLVVFRDERLVGVVGITARSERCLHDALRAIPGLSRLETDTLFRRAVRSPARKAAS